MRWLLVTGVALLGLVLVLVWAADVQPRSPWVSATQLEWPGASFRVVVGQGRSSPGGLHVSRAAGDHSALQALPLQGVDAADTPFLRYRFSDFPRTLELALMFRRADQSGDVEVVSLPWPGEGFQTVDLSVLEQWRGRIIELGFAQFPTAQLVPEERGFAPFTLEQAGLWSPSWRVSLAALDTQWLERRPWQLISASALGPRSVTDTAQYRPRLPLVAALLAALAAVAIAATRGGMSRHGLLRGALLAGAVAWLMVDAVWLRDLAFKKHTDADIWAQLPLAQRQEHVFASDVQTAATQLRQVLADAGPEQRILLYGGSTFEALSLAYRAAPLNIGLLSQNHDNVPLPDNSIVVGWHTGESLQDGALRLGGGRTPVAPVAANDGLQVFRVQWPEDIIFHGGMSERSDAIFADSMAARPADRISTIGHERPTGAVVQDKEPSL